MLRVHVPHPLTRRRFGCRFGRVRLRRSRDDFTVTGDFNNTYEVTQAIGTALAFSCFHEPGDLASRRSATIIILPYP